MTDLEGRVKSGGKFGAKVRHFWDESRSDTVFVGCLILGNVIYTAATGQTPPPLEETLMVMGIKAGVDYFEGEATIKNKRENLKGGQILKRYIKTDAKGDAIETTAIGIGTYVVLEYFPGLYSLQNGPDYALDLVKGAGIVGLASLGLDAVGALFAPVVKWAANTYYKSQNDRFKSDTPSGTPQ